MKIEIAPLLLVMPFYWLCLCNHIFVVSALCLEDQQSLLLQLQNNLTFNPDFSSKLILWNQSTACCDWSGVTCDIEGHVIRLDLSGESISGGFDNSSSLFSLQHLQKLNLAFNSFNSVIPSGFNKLEELTYLNLSNNLFAGQIPIEISQLTRLVTLDISSPGQELKLENPNLQKLVQNLTSIRQLVLDGVIITAQGQEWCNALLPLRDLQELRMSSCNLSGPLDSSLTRLENLSVIVLDRNNFSSTVPETFSNFKNLTTHNLAFSELTGKFPNSLSNLIELSYLDLSYNSFTGLMPSFSMAKNLTHLDLSHNGLSGAIPSFFMAINLTYLDLSHNGLSGAISQFTPNSLSNLIELSYLDLSYNSFTGPMPSFSMAKNLTHLDLSHNGLSGAIASSLFTLPLLQNIQLAFNKFSRLEEFTNVSSSMLNTLDLSSNNLSLQLDKFLLLRNLTTIDLSYNNLSVNVSVFPSSFPNIKILGLASYNLKTIPGFLRNISSLTWLDLSHNGLSGAIPSSLFTLPWLEIIYLNSNLFSKLEEFTNVSSSILNTLYLSSNNLSLQLDKFLLLRNLTSLHLSYNNNLSVNVSVFPSSFPNIEELGLASCNLKTIPGFLRNRFSLTRLDLSHNKIQGTVPNWIWKLQNLERLNISYNLLTDLEGPVDNITFNLEFIDLHNNQLHGPLPGFPKYAYYLDYSTNKFSSVIPHDIGNYLSNIIFLSLSNNTLLGSIPDSLCNASNLEVLDLSMNNISGTIPSCLMRSENLGVLNLRTNNLTGPIPDMFPASCDLRTLDLHKNQLEGQIPKSLANCSKLEVLDLATNQIIDGFPCLLKNVSTLRVLVLRKNKFYGPIGCQKTNDTWHMLQILDLASNNFNGELPGESFTSWMAMMSNENQADSEENDIYYEIDFELAIYYHDSVQVMIKGLQMELVKILTIFTTIDFSSNHFHGEIPKQLFDFKALHLLNLSNNALSGYISSSIGNMKQLESLDLSNNSLEGEIPTQLASLSFLSFLNLSFNKLSGQIPIGTQIQSFPETSFIGNKGLFGPPLSIITKYPNNSVNISPPFTECGRLACSIEWNFLSVELGFVFGIGTLISSLLFWKQGRVLYWKLVHKFLCSIFPQLYLKHVTHRGQNYMVLRWQY